MVYDCISMCESDVDFYMGLHTKRHMTTNSFLLKQPFLHHLVIFKSFVTLIILSTDFLIHSQTFVDSDKDCGLREGGEISYFWYKIGIRRFFLSEYCSLAPSLLACNFSFFDIMYSLLRYKKPHKALAIAKTKPKIQNELTKEKSITKCNKSILVGVFAKRGTTNRHTYRYCCLSS